VPGSLSDLLRRFRPAVAPGPAAPAGVPADRLAEAQAELAPVFAAIQPAVAQARQLREQAAAEATRRRDEGREEAARVVADARARLGAVRAEAAATSIAALEAERAKVDERARAEVDRIRRVAEGRAPGVVAAVVARVRLTGAAPADDASGPDRREPDRSEVAG
jgi:hypothetical protein